MLGSPTIQAPVKSGNLVKLEKLVYQNIQGSGEVENLVKLEKL